MKARAFVSREDLSRPATPVIGEIAQRYLASADSAWQRLMAADDDPEALHDFRVGLRQLRSTIKAFPDCLQTLGPRQRKRLRKLARATNTARDREVQIGYLRSWRESAARSLCPGLDWLIQRLQEQEQAAYADVHAAVSTDFPALAGKLRKRLKRLAGSGKDILFAARLAEQLHLAGREFQQELDGIHTARDDQRLHAARIAGKRVRYLITPLDKGIERVGDLTRDLKRIQDHLGEYHDMQVLETVLIDQAGGAAAEDATRQLERIRGDGNPVPADPMLGIYRVAEIIRQRKQTLWEELAAEYRDGVFTAFLDELDAFIDSLRADGLQARAGSAWSTSGSGTILGNP